MHQPAPDLLQGCLRNDRRAQFALYDLCFQELMRIATRYAPNRDDASALVNTAFMKLLHSLDRYDGQRPFGPWMRTLAVRVAIDQHRAEVQRQEWLVGDEWPSNAEPEVSAEIVDQLDVEHIERALATLPEVERMVFNLFAVEGFSHEEIGAELGFTARTSRRLLHRSKESLQKMLISSAPAQRNAV